MSLSALHLRLGPPAGPAGREGRGAGTGAAQPAATPRQTYLTLLTWAFTLFNSVRVFSYLPTLWAIHASGDSSQHSLITWLTWLGANVTMALWLYEHNGQRCNRAVMVNISNAVMCLATSALIAWHRF
jgi:hypothetical protein